MFADIFRDDKYQVDIFSARQMKAAFKKLYPSWKQDVENQIGNVRECDVCIFQS